MRMLKDSLWQQNDEVKVRTYQNVGTFETQSHDEEIGLTQGTPSKITRLPPSSQQNFKNQCNILGLLILIGAIISYQNINELCPFETDGECVNFFLKPNVQKWVSLAIFSACCYVGLFVLAYNNIINRFFILAEAIVLFYFIIYQDHIISTQNYQALFQAGETLFIIIVATIVASVSFCTKFYQRYGRTFVMSLLTFCALIYFYSLVKINASCNNWMKGLEGEEIDQSSGFCTVKEPTACWYDLFDGKMDASKLYDCTLEPKSIQPEWLKTIQKYVQIPEGTKYIELPRTEYFNTTQRSLTYAQFQPHFFKQLKFSKTKDDMLFETETYLDLEKMEYVTKIVKNETLAKERKLKNQELQDQIKDRTLPKNIIVLYVDAVSRARFMQKLPKSVGWFAEQAKKKEESHVMFQALRYMSVAFHTQPNYMAFEYGIVFDSQEHNKTARWATTTGYQNTSLDTEGQPILTDGRPKWSSVTKDLQEAGYMVGKARMQCGASIMEHDSTFEEFLEVQSPDHELTGVMCDPNFQSPENAFGMMKGPYSILKKCLYNQEVNSYLFEYGKQFLSTYSDQPKYIELEFLDGHEGTGDAIQHFDDPLRNFLDYLDSNEMQKDSLILLLSDHGLHMQGLYFLLHAEIYSIEVALPGMFLLADQSIMLQRHKESLKQNQQKVVTFFELHYLLKYITTSKDVNTFYEDNSLFSEVIPRDRTCKDIPLSPTSYCACSS